MSPLKKANPNRIFIDLTDVINYEILLLYADDVKLWGANI
jgi:hypothetical protein